MPGAARRQRAKTVFRCSECGHVSPAWYGKCPGCSAWSTMTEEIETEERPSGRSSSSSAEPIELGSIEADGNERTRSGIDELDRVLGGGLVPGAVVLLAGEPGIGKSTLMLQMARGLAESGSTVLMVTGEESPRQMRLRADRIGMADEGIWVLAETEIAAIEAVVVERAPDCVVVDSIQTVSDADIESSPGSVTQVRDCTTRLTRLAKQKGIPTFLVGHITKEGQVAGPRVLEHMVDTVLYFEGDKAHPYRVVRAAKNRFGSVSEIGLFEMVESGLIPVDDPSARLLAERPAGAAGSVVVPVMEGTRPLLVELQALVAASFLPSPRRLANGVEYNRMLQVLAILERHGGIRLDGQDVFASVAGGVRVTEPAGDLALAMAIVSAGRERPVDPGSVIFGELGLTGEVRVVGHSETRIREAEARGFESAIAPPGVQGRKGLKVLNVSTLGEALAAIEEG